MDVCCIFPQCVLAVIPLTEGVTGVVVTKAFSLLCGCHSPVGGRVCSPLVGVEDPRSVSELRCEIGGTGACLVGEEPLSIPPQELSTRECALWCCLSPVVWAQKVHCCWHCPQLHLNHGNTSNRPWCPSGPVFTKPPVQIGRRRSTEVRYQDLSSCALRPAVGATESAQTPAPPLHVPTKPTAANARPTPAVGAPVIHLDVLWVLSLQRPSGGGINLWIAQPWGKGSDFSS